MRALKTRAGATPVQVVYSSRRGSRDMYASEQRWADDII
jgi:hypothetical protein